MRKSVTISEKEYELVTNAYTPIAYKSEFGKDFFQDLFLILLEIRTFLCQKLFRQRHIL